MAGYSKLVLFWKFFLALLTAGTITLLVWVAARSGGDSGGRMVFSDIPKADIVQNIMKNPRYRGIDIHNRPYTVEADTALQKEKDLVVLKNINAEITGDNNAWIALKAGSGELNTAKKEIELFDGVEIFYEGGYEFRSDRATVDINKGTAKGNSKIEGQGGAGTLTANSFFISERGNIIKFNGSVRMLLYE